jgi:HNH endonuclease
VTYEEYLLSPWWRARKALIVRYRGERCERCGCRYLLELHHRSYERLGRERPEDVELLCWICHQREHGFTCDMGRNRRWRDLETGYLTPEAVLEERRAAAGGAEGSVPQDRGSGAAVQTPAENGATGQEVGLTAAALPEDS